MSAIARHPDVGVMISNVELPSNDSFVKSEDSKSDRQGRANRLQVLLLKAMILGPQHRATKCLNLAIARQ